jgi:hypothetical protein
MRVGISLAITRRSGLPDITPATLSDLTISGPDVSAVMSEAGKVYMIWETVATARTRAYVKAAAIAHSASLDYTWNSLVAGGNSVSVDDSSLSGTYYVKFAPEDVYGNLGDALTADQVTAVIGAKLTFIAMTKVATPTNSVVVSIPSSGSFVVCLTTSRTGAGITVSTITGSTGITIDSNTDGTNGDTGSVTLSSNRQFFKWATVTASQAGTVTFALSASSNLVFQAYSVVKLKSSANFASRTGQFTSNGTTTTLGQSATLTHTSMPANTVNLYAGLKYQNAGDAPVTMSGSVTNTDNFGEFLRNGDANNLGAHFGGKADLSGALTDVYTYTPLGFILVSAICITVT